MAQLFGLRQFISQIFPISPFRRSSDCDTITFMPHTDTISSPLAFIGGGNMASAIIGGLIKQGTPAESILVVEPFDEARERIAQQFKLKTYPVAGPALNEAGLVIWAVKPQVFKEAALFTGAFCPQALHLSVAAGIRSDSIAQWLSTERVVRAMPNTPALVGLGQTGLFARPAVTTQDKAWIDRIVATTGQYLWVNDESLLDAVTAISGSGPAYVFFFIEAMVQAGVKMGLTEAQAHQLAVGTFVGASELARSASESPAVLRERVTSKGGTTYAAITAMQAACMSEHFQAALVAAQQRAAEMGEAFGS